jgi:hypothetical protein
VKKLCNFINGSEGPVSYVRSSFLYSDIVFRVLYIVKSQHYRSNVYINLSYLIPSKLKSRRGIIKLQNS